MHLKKKYPMLRQCFELFNMEAGLDDEFISKTLKDGWFNNEEFKQELVSVFNDDKVDWVELGLDDGIELPIDEENSECIRQFIIENVWVEVFPNSEVPTGKRR